MKYEIMEQETCSKIQQTIKVMHFLLTSHECDWCICVCVCLCSMPQLRLFSFCCQVRAKCQNSELGVCIWLCVCKYGSYSESSNYASAIQICLCVCVCVHVLVRYQGNSPSLNKPLVCFGCSLLWACCPPGCCLSALFESVIKALPLSPPWHPSPPSRFVFHF